MGMRCRTAFVVAADASCFPRLAKQIMQQLIVREGVAMAAPKDETRRERVRDFVSRNPDMSSSQVLKHFVFEGYNRFTVYNIMRKIKAHRYTPKELGIVRKAKRESPYAGPKQKKRKQFILIKIYRDEFKAAADNIDIIMDDETYIDVNGHDFAGNNHYYTSGLDAVPEDVKFKMMKAL